MNCSIVYLDNNATTQCAPEVIEAMLPFFSGNHGNASSPHFLGRQAARAIAIARENVAESIGCSATNVYFTSGATESNNLIILGIAQMSTARNKIVTSMIEHKSVLGPCEALINKGFDVVKIPVKNDGVVDLDAIIEAVDTNTLLVSVQGANNEIGTLQPIKAIADISHEKGAALHCDASQLLGKLPFDINKLCADFISFSSHKAYGPKGVGLLIMNNNIRDISIAPLLFGGGQEQSYRPGTLNVPGIVGTGEACHICARYVLDDMKRITSFRHQLEEGIFKMVPDAQVIAQKGPRLPGTASVLFPGIPADLLIARTPTVCMSRGSACTSGAIAPSHVLLALGFSHNESQFVVRFSIGRYNSKEDIQIALNSISHALKDLSFSETSQSQGDESVVSEKEVAI
jgi:cysteine desulfurase